MWLRTENTLINLDNAELIYSTQVPGDEEEILIDFRETEAVSVFRGTEEDCQALLDRIKHAIQDRVRVLEI